MTVSRLVPCLCPYMSHHVFILSNGQGENKSAQNNPAQPKCKVTSACFVIIPLPPSISQIQARMLDHIALCPFGLSSKCCHGWPKLFSTTEITRRKASVPPSGLWMNLFSPNASFQAVPCLQGGTRLVEPVFTGPRLFGLGLSQTRGEPTK